MICRPMGSSPPAAAILWTVVFGFFPTAIVVVVFTSRRTRGAQWTCPPFTDARARRSCVRIVAPGDRRPRRLTASPPPSHSPSRSAGLRGPLGQRGPPSSLKSTMCLGGVNGLHARLAAVEASRAELRRSSLRAGLDRLPRRVRARVPRGRVRGMGHDSAPNLNPATKASNA